MAYISTENVKLIRNEIKKQFPKFKFSIVREDSSVIDIRILSGPMNLEHGHEFNKYHPDYTENKEFRIMCEKIHEIVNKIAPVEYHETSDYGNQPNYYCYIKVGKWDKKYQVVINGK